MSEILREKIDEAMGDSGLMSMEDLKDELEDLGVQVCFYKEGELESKIRDMDPVDDESFAVDIYHGQVMVERVEYGYP